jgi:hypothetical protein
MTDAQKKKPGREIGGINRFATFGGNDEETPEPSDVETPKRSDAQATRLPNTKTPKRLDVQTAKRSNDQGPESLNVQTPRRSDIQSLSSQNLQALKRSDIQTSSSQDVQTLGVKRIRQTVYLEPDIDNWIRHHIADTRQEISSVVNEALRRYREHIRSQQS